MRNADADYRRVSKSGGNVHQRITNRCPENVRTPGDLNYCGA
jgi:hypothetical protein